MERPDLPRTVYHQLRPDHAFLLYMQGVLIGAHLPEPDIARQLCREGVVQAQVKCLA